MFNIIDRNPGFNFIEFIKLKVKKKVKCEEELIFFGYGRGALFAVLKSLGLENRDDVLVPSYVCDIVINQIKALNLNPIYYAIDENLKINFQSLSTELTNKTKVLITINYFGFGQKFEILDEFSRENNLIWINDNAHGYSSYLSNRSLDSYGDVSITSYRKSIASINGAYVKINNSLKLNKLKILDILKKYTKENLSLRIVVLNLFRTINFRYKKYPDFSNPAGFKDLNKMQYKVSSLSKRNMLNLGDLEVKKKRAKLYYEIREFMKKNYPNIKLPTLYEIGNAPLNFPIIVSNKKLWKDILKISRAEGIDIHTWPSLPDDVFKKNIHGAADLWGKLLFLPLHQNIDFKNYKNRIDKVFSKASHHE